MKITLINQAIFHQIQNEMDTNKILIGGVAGGVAAYLFGFVIWALALDSFSKAHSLAPAGLEKNPPEMWAMIVGCLALGFLYSVIYGRWAGISTLKTGAMAGAVIGLLMGINGDFMMYSMMNVTDLTGVIVDVLAYAVHGSLVGGVVGYVLGMGKTA